MDLTKVILYPLNTEKTYLIKDNYNQYAFIVDSHATKLHIKMAFAAIFNVIPLAVNTTLRKPKPTRYINKKQGKGHTKLMKIAYITLPKDIVLGGDDNASSKLNEANKLDQKDIVLKESSLQ